jgi:hypothetical protein
MNEQIILSKLYEYLKKKKIKYKKVGRTSATLECIFCKTGTMQVLPNTYKVNCFSCKPKDTLGHYYTLIDIARKVEQFPDTKSNEDILQYLKEFLKINVMTKKDEENIDKILDFYEKNGFDLVPLAVKCPFCFEKGCDKCDNTGNYGKNPIEKDWTNKVHKDKIEWKRWLVNGLNIGVKCGQCSNLLVIDLDHQEEIPESIKKLMGKTLVQKTAHGWHLFYKYDKDFPKTRIDELKIDTETTGGQVVIYPSKTSNIQRKIILNPIIEIPKELKKLLLDKITVPRKTISEEIKEDISTEDFKINPKDFILKNNNLEGCCNSSFIKLGGILRKQLNVKQTGYVLHTLNKHLLEDPMPSRDITAMLRELDRYSEFDERELAHKIIEYLKDVEEASRTEIAMAIVGTNRGEDKKRIDKSLTYLVKEDYLVKRGARYILIKKAEWKESLIETGKPIDFKMPYFYDIANFNWGDLILIGSKNKKGKTHLAMNIVKRLVTQGKKPYYLSLETGSRFAKIAMQLGLKEGDFYWDFQVDPTKIELEENAITIIDWLCPTNFAEVDKLFMHFIEQLYKTNGILIVFMQLKGSKAQNNEWFAPNLIAQFPALGAKYIYDNEGDGEYGKFIIDPIRDPKIKIKSYEIPCFYNWETKELTRVDELEKNKKE